MINISPDLIGTRFTVKAKDVDPTAEFVCKGFAYNSTFLVVGCLNDTINNRFTMRTFKLSDTTFIGQVKSNL